MFIMKEFPHLRFHTHGLHFWHGCVLVVYKYFVMHFEDQEVFNLSRRWTCIPASTFWFWLLVGSDNRLLALGISITYPAFLTCYSRSTDCKTTAGDHCIFPFNYKGVTYTGCAIFGASTNHQPQFTVSWCATQTWKGNVMKWGRCDAATCPMDGCRI